MTVVVMPDRSSMGQGTYEPVPGSGSFLSFELPDGQHATLGDRRLEPRHSAALELGEMVDRA